jgi:hypothetical protein
VAVELLVERAVLHVPDPDGEVRALGPVPPELLPAAAAGEVTAVGRERDRPHDVPMLLPDPDGAELPFLEGLEQLGRPEAQLQIIGRLGSFINLVPSRLSNIYQPPPRSFAGVIGFAAQVVD